MSVLNRVKILIRKCVGNPVINVLTEEVLWSTEEGAGIKEVIIDSPGPLLRGFLNLFAVILFQNLRSAFPKVFSATLTWTICQPLKSALLIFSQLVPAPGFLSSVIVAEFSVTHC